MQIGSDVHNYMETLVGQVLAAEEFVDRFTNEQLSDIACLALNRVRPVYIRYDIDFLSALPEERLVVLKQHVDKAVEAAMAMIIDDRRKNREDNDITVIYNNPRHNEDAELEWYEQPLTRLKK
ncbi:Late competence development protein ComFB [Vibrio xiamenensis]|uniref:Late competence development protein ComFB n=1 Tax=Vibrio xiamenensis TaxID=861298 RepID=A0A1G7YTT0_9VIBR|nr:late competence development ComFB family protein [Vibrio xiamenensis]SDG99676.1 Late competence development protein ComFB [Vibrio xiamenensis]